MGYGLCSAEQVAACPLQQHLTDTHHLAYPRRQYVKGIDKLWRELSINKIQICRALHNAIHASGYIPEKPAREEMAQEAWLGALTERSIGELDHQLEVGHELIEERNYG